MYKNPTITKLDLIALGYGAGTAEALVKQAKQNLAQSGYAYYENSRLGRVPWHAIESILGINPYTAPLEGAPLPYEAQDNPTITKHDLSALGYGRGQVESLIRLGKEKMVALGFPYYANPRVGRVPATAFKDILAFTPPALIPSSNLTKEELA